jgi:hypothetical protein
MALQHRLDMLLASRRRSYRYATLVYKDLGSGWGMQPIQQRVSVGDIGEFLYDRTFWPTGETLKDLGIGFKPSPQTCSTDSSVLITARTMRLDAATRNKLGSKVTGWVSAQIRLKRGRKLGVALELKGGQLDRLEAIGAVLRDLREAAANGRFPVGHVAVVEVRTVDAARVAMVESTHAVVALEVDGKANFLTQMLAGVPVGEAHGSVASGRGRITSTHIPLAHGATPLYRMIQWDEKWWDPLPPRWIRIRDGKSALARQRRLRQHVTPELVRSSDPAALFTEVSPQSLAAEEARLTRGELIGTATGVVVALAGAAAWWRGRTGGRIGG